MNDATECADGYVNEHTTPNIINTPNTLNTPTISTTTSATTLTNTQYNQQCALDLLHLLSDFKYETYCL